MSGTPAFQSTGFQTGKKNSPDSPAFQGAINDPNVFTLNVGSSISGGQFTRGAWHKLKKEIADEAARELAIKQAKEAAIKAKAEAKAKAEKAKREAERLAARQEAERVAAEQRAALTAAHSLAAHQSARQMMQQLQTLHLANNAQRAAIEKALREDDEAALMLLLHMDK
jgi:hypothetical protein